MKIKKWKKFASNVLANINNSILDIDVLLTYVLNKPRSWILCYEDYDLNSKEIKMLNKLLIRRFYNEPLAYLIQTKEFWSLNFFISNKTLIPRPDSEILVEQSLMKIKNYPYKILDLGTGCGNIAIAIAHSKLNCHVTGIDYSSEIINIARYNANNFNLKNIIFFCSNWFSSICNTKYHIIVSNPPYISYKEFFFLKNNLKFEPITALISKNNGFSDIIKIIKYSQDYLFNKGWLLIEHGWKQKKMIQKLFKLYNYINIQTYKDYSGKNRVTSGQKYY
ncbi:peptide chain release factor N(5)-glutamine methyltransferase [Buchnera aphidicola]|uniref:peptide chain release factor N(5)-glutamine methyltransferase n=1 Tax=Buchnera aphidicola TaxID=9 RepID=UPI002238C058|nr:peptide chain release factor N(5)-glutamine methyltransferase [Buchnera aphidicola]MCW5197747.1 peptide chain release factor N(5)-glutamine methyltransferase [Buchnera aphidicola (Chaitophorus viminalis)]